MKYIRFTFPGLSRIKMAFGMRRATDTPDIDDQGNISFAVGHDPDKITANRLALKQHLGFDGWHGLRQVHGDTMLLDPEGSTLAVPSSREADGQATTRPGLALAIKTADCQPILLAHRGGRHVAALHVGWRGNRLGFPITGVTAFCRHYCLSPADLLAVRGPSLGPKSAQFTNFDLEFGPDYATYFDPLSQTMDLWRLTRDQLIQAGLKPEHIFAVDRCTLAGPDFFSHRRDPASGRQASLIWIGE